MEKDRVFEVEGQIISCSLDCQGRFGIQGHSRRFGLGEADIGYYEVCNHPDVQRVTGAGGATNLPICLLRSPEETLNNPLIKDE